MTMPKLVPLLIALAIFVPTHVRCAEPPAQTTADPQELVIGDWYEATVEINGAAKQVDGHLVKATDDWIVLGTICCQSSTASNYPNLARLPYLGRLFLKTEPYYSKCYKWVSRSHVKLTSRTPIDKAELKKDFSDEPPELVAPLTVYQVSGKESSAIVDDLVEVQASEICLTSMKAEVVQVKKGKTKERIVQRRQQTKIPLDNVSYIFQQVPYDYLKNHPEIKQAAK